MLSRSALTGGNTGGRTTIHLQNRQNTTSHSRQGACYSCHSDPTVTFSCGECNKNHDAGVSVWLILVTPVNQSNPIVLLHWGKRWKWRHTHTHTHTHTQLNTLSHWTRWHRRRWRRRSLPRGGQYVTVCLCVCVCVCVCVCHSRLSGHGGAEPGGEREKNRAKHIFINMWSRQ